MTGIPRLYYRTGGTANFAWYVVTTVAGQSVEDRRRQLHIAGYATILAVEPPTEFQPAGVHLGRSMDQ